MQVELELPEAVVRKIKALNALESGHTAVSLQDKIVGLLEQTIDQAIASYLGPTINAFMLPQQRQSEPSPKNHGATKERSRYNPIDDLFPSLEDGLGDLDETEIEPEEDEEALVPKKGGLTESSLDNDMQVDDPEHEAKVDAPELGAPYSKAEEVFAHVSGIPVPTEHTGEIDARIAGRKRRLNIRGRVVPMSDEYEGERSSF